MVGFIQKREHPSFHVVLHLFWEGREDPEPDWRWKTGHLLAQPVINPSVKMPTINDKNMLKHTMTIKKNY